MSLPFPLYFITFRTNLITVHDITWHYMAYIHSVDIDLSKPPNVIKFHQIPVNKHPRSEFPSQWNNDLVRAVPTQTVLHNFFWNAMRFPPPVPVQEKTGFCFSCLNINVPLRSQFNYQAKVCTHIPAAHVAKFIKMCICEWKWRRIIAFRSCLLYRNIGHNMLLWSQSMHRHAKKARAFIACEHLAKYQNWSQKQTGTLQAFDSLWQWLNHCHIRIENDWALDESCLILVNPGLQPFY